jgi:iron complex outermembrane receptor protein
MLMRRAAFTNSILAKNLPRAMPGPMPAVCAAVALAFAAPGLVRADESTPGTSDTSTEALAPIVVTAQKRQEDIEKAALSVAVIDGKDLQQTGRVQLEDVLGQVGSVKILQGQDGPTFYIRGVGTGVPSSIGDPEVNLNIDGVYQSEPEYSRAGLYDINRIEVLRGPQGTLYGRNALAGAVNIVTNDPSRTYGASGSVGFGNDDLVQAQGALNLPVNDQLAVRAAFGTESHRGYLSNGADDADVQSGRLKVLWTPDDRTRILVAYDVTHEGGQGEGEVQLTPPPTGFPTGTSGLGNSYASSNPWTSPDPSTASRNTTFWSLRMQADLDLGFATLAVLPAYRSYSYSCMNCWRSETDQINVASEKQTTLETRLTSPDGQPVKWLAGLYYLKADTPSSNQQLGPGADSFSNSSGNAVNLFGQNEYDAKSYAAFGQGTLPLTSQLRLTAGLRTTKDRKSETAYVASETGGTVTVTTGLFSSAKSWAATTYRAGIEYDVNPSSMLYASVSTGYKSGGFYQGATPDSYDPEHLTAYELGSKGRYLDNRLELNADVFYYDYKDYQVNYLGFINPTSAGIFGVITANADGAHAYGAEIEARYLATRHDSIDLGIDLLRAHFKNLVIPGFFGGTYTGDVLPYAPVFSSNLGYQHTWSLAGDASIAARVESHFESPSWVSFSEHPDTNQGAHTISNLYLSYQAPAHRWGSSLYLKNAENRAVLANAQGGPAGLETVDVGPPRTWGMQFWGKF